MAKKKKSGTKTKMKKPKALAHTKSLTSFAFNKVKVSYNP